VHRFRDSSSPTQHLEALLSTPAGDVLVNVIETWDSILGSNHDMADCRAGGTKLPSYAAEVEGPRS
jgi:hypothetical protein